MREWLEITVINGGLKKNKKKKMKKNKEWEHCLWVWMARRWIGKGFLIGIANKKQIWMIRCQIPEFKIIYEAEDYDQENWI